MTTGSIGVGKGRRWPHALILLALLAAGTWPYWGQLPYGPMNGDSAYWVVRGATDRPDWFEWTFLSRHLAGYRPVAAVSYSLNYLTSGFAPLSYRLLDVVLHLGVACLIFAFYRRLARGMPAWGGWVASGLFLAHPLAEQIVPILARRSYSLATLFGLSALIVSWDGLAQREPRNRPALLGALLLAAGLLGNETAFVMGAVAAALPFFVRGPRLDRVTVTYAGFPLLACALALALRWWVVGGLGGYAAGAVFRGMDRTAAVYTELYAGPWWVGVAFLLFCGWRVVASYRVAEPFARAASLLLLWLLLSPVPSLISGTWFLRQLYPTLVPFCLLVGILVASAVSDDARTRWMSGFRLAVPLVLVAGILFHSPSVRGPDAGRLQAWQERRQLLDELHEALTPVRGPAHVLLVLPYSPRKGRMPGPQPWITRLPAVWAAARLDNRDVVVEGFRFYEQSQQTAGLTPVVRTRDGRPELIVPAGLPVHSAVGPAGPDHLVRITRLDDVPARGDLYVYLRDGDRGELVQVR